LNEPAGIAVDPSPDPATGETGDVYIADGYGNHRVVVFNSEGKYLRQFGSAGRGDGQFDASGGGHPHCVLIGNDNLVYACDRGQSRIEVFDKMGIFKRHIFIRPTSGRPTDIVFSTDKAQTYMLVEDSGAEAVWIVDRQGAIVGGFGRGGHAPGEFTSAHTLAGDSRGNLYVAETGGGRRIQKFVLEH
jgi:DNA-binding beta-propeller fold protein YncE